MIPKKEGANYLSDFKPISLLGSTYKIISKCLTLRLRFILPSIISKEQGAFLSGRSITDGFLCASECIDDRARSGTPGVICKLDMEKAYDHVNWDFLYYILRRYGFGNRWKEWLWKCFSYVSYSVLFNGILSCTFEASRGLRQGDSLSRLLFLLLAETLGTMVSKALEGGLIDGFRVGREEVIVSHLQYADDTLVLCGHH